MNFGPWSQAFKSKVAIFLVVAFLLAALFGFGWLDTASNSVSKEDYVTCEEEVIAKNSLLLQARNKVSSLNASLNSLKSEKWLCDTDLSSCEENYSKLREDYLNCLDERNYFSEQLTYCNSELQDCKLKLTNKNGSDNILPTPYENKVYYTNFIVSFSLILVIGFSFSMKHEWGDKKLNKMFSTFVGVFSITMLILGYVSFIEGFWPKFAIAFILALFVGAIYSEN